MCCDGGMGSGDGFFGGAGGPTMNTPMNTLGVGDLIPAGTHEMGNDCYPWMNHGRKKIKNISTKKGTPVSRKPFVTPGVNTGYDFSPRPMFVPTRGPRKKR